MSMQLKTNHSCIENNVLQSEYRPNFSPSPESYILHCEINLKPDWLYFVNSTSTKGVARS